MLIDRTSQLLNEAWKEIVKLAKAGKLDDCLSEKGLIAAVRESVNSRTKSYRYVLPTQVLAKVADSSLDCCCLQASRGGAGAFDARTIAHKVVVPFDQANENVLGGSSEPYVNNPLRVQEVSPKFRKPQRDPEGWDHLCEVLEAVERKRDHQFTRKVLKQILIEVYRRLSSVHVAYPVPRRISLQKTLELIEKFTLEHSGGDRLLALASAVFITIGKHFGLFSQVRRAKITAADVASGMLADLECLDSRGEIVLAVEVKDRQITVSHLKGKMRNIREKQVSEIFFIAQGIARADTNEVLKFQQNEFASGQNLYILDLPTLAQVTLALVGEKGRHAFLLQTANQLDQYQSDIAHRRAWATLLSSV